MYCIGWRYDVPFKTVLAQKVIPAQNMIALMPPGRRRIKILIHPAHRYVHTKLKSKSALLPSLQSQSGKGTARQGANPRGLQWYDPQTHRSQLSSLSPGAPKIAIEKAPIAGRLEGG